MDQMKFLRNSHSANASHDQTRKIGLLHEYHTFKSYIRLLQKLVLSLGKQVQDL